MFDIYDFFNSRDIADHCKTLNHSFSAIETAYLVWHSNHHSLADKHTAWQRIIDALPDEQFPTNWDFDNHTLHSFLRTYMCLQNEFINDFCATKKGYIYTYATLLKQKDYYQPDDIFFDSYDACLDALKHNELDDDPDDEIKRARITRHRLYSSHVSFYDAQEGESVVFDKHLRPMEIEPAYKAEGNKKFLCASYGFYEMWVAIPTPFHKGDIVTDVDDYVGYPPRHRPVILERIPYWRKDANNGSDCSAEINRLLNLGVDWTDMQAGFYFQDDNGEIYWNHAFDYLDLEYYREELQGTEKLLASVSSAMQRKISVEELLQSFSIILMENYVMEKRRFFGDNLELLQLCGLTVEKSASNL